MEQSEQPGEHTQGREPLPLKHRPGKRFPFPGLPSGWYVVAVSSELKAGALIARHYFERDLVIYRGQSGAVRVTDAFCPHMGGNLGRLGKVEGDDLKCGFHGFRYANTGQCVATHDPDVPPPATARLKFWESREQNGLIMVWFDRTSQSPTWEVPTLECDDWNPILWKRFRIATHPQETTENSVDFTHFTQVHGFVDGSITRSVEVDGPLLTSSYRAHRPLGVPGLPRYKLRVDYDVKVWGLGYSQVDVRIDDLHLDIRVFILPVPVDEEHIDLITGASTPRKLGPLAPLARKIALNILTKEVGEDLDIWTHKTYLDTPALSKIEGQVAVYRRYVRQFYPKDGPSQSASDSPAIQ
jgi:nitrite reductase/ring-hydroxylating ferredoxin subunit